MGESRENFPRAAQLISIPIRTPAIAAAIAIAMVSSTVLTTGRFPTFHLGMTAVTAMQMTRASETLCCNVCS
ncbi:hypothetical protein [Methanoregula sp.]|uniref:hypothetical protein n=1 Tax=Methanoregula sp. TaxID=2052170 RepID=UPI003C1FCB78